MAAIDKNSWSQQDYSELATKAAKLVLVEIPRVLGAYYGRVVLMGGSVPPLLLPGFADEHVGTIDVDLAVDHQSITDDEYKHIEELLSLADYDRGDKPYVFLRTVEVSGIPVTVQIELLAAYYGGTSKRHHTQTVQSINALKIRGCELAFRMNQEVKIEGVLPDGNFDSNRVRVINMVGLLSTKGLALAGRRKYKDAYDIYFCVVHCDDIDALAKEIRECMDDKYVAEGMRNIAEKFASTKHTGPADVVTFLGILDEEEQAAVRQDAYQQIDRLMEKVNLK